MKRYDYVVSNNNGSIEEIADTLREAKALAKKYSKDKANGLVRVERWNISEGTIDDNYDAIYYSDGEVF